MKRLSITLSAVALLSILAYGLGLAAEPAGPKTYIVRIESMKFMPNMISVRPGDTVEFFNTDLVPHTVTERSTRAFDSGMINAKATWKLVTDEEGTLLYRCIYHPDMMGTIVVETAAKNAARNTPAAVELCGAP
ncbi:MAG: copper-binding protein [Opitutae bacterium]|nr:copper-binding protein [Opitutae bacterium]